MIFYSCEALDEKDPPKIKKVKKYLKELDYKASNACQKFAVALELKFRGTDRKVTDTPSPLSRCFDVPVGGSYPLQNWMMFKNAKPTPISGDPVESITKTMKSWGKGSRAICALSWKSGRGHVFNVLNIDGEIYLADASANRFKSLSSSNYVKNETDVKKSLGLIRTDSGSPDKDMLDATFDEEGRPYSATMLPDETTIKSKFISILQALNAYSSGNKDISSKTFEINFKGKKIGIVKPTEIVQTYGDSIRVWGYNWK